MPRPQGSDRRRAGERGRVDRSERTVVFGKTKLCKFNILGVCSKGADCNFAHDAAELNQPPDLAKTKVCKALINTGRCDDPDCRYAHNRNEIREMPTVDPGLVRSRAAAPPLEGGGGSAAPSAPPVMPNFASAFGQAFGQPFGLPAGGQSHDPQAQAMVLQQLAAQLSMQAAMIQAAHGGGGWPGQQPGASPAAQWLTPPQALAPSAAPQRDARPARAVPVELAALTPQPNLPAFVGHDGKGKGRGSDGPGAGAGKNQQRRIQNGRVNGFGADGPWAKPPTPQMPSGLTAASMASPLMLPTDFTPTAASMASPLMLPTDFGQDPPALQLGSLFDSPKSSHGNSPEFSFSGLGALKENDFRLKETESVTFDELPEIVLKETIESHDSTPMTDTLGTFDTFDVQGRGRTTSYGGEKRLQDTPVLGGIMVKHTFLDVQPEGPKAGMRSVQTHSGSLCLMTEQDDDDDEVPSWSRRISDA